MNVVVPMAGEGLRLKEGYKMPKPFININGEPMFNWALKSIDKDNNFIFIVRKDHSMAVKIIKDYYPNAEIIIQEGKLDGAVKTIELAEKYIDNDMPLMIVDCDISVNINMYDFITNALMSYDGAIVTFTSTDTKYSYAKTQGKKVYEVAEKKAISNDAIAGVFFWSKGSDYVKYSKALIEKDIRVNDEFYVSTVFNEAIKDNKEITFANADSFFHLGTTKELEDFIEENRERS
mgnify:CR=1 FL=1